MGLLAFSLPFGLDHPEPLVEIRALLSPELARASAVRLLFG